MRRTRLPLPALTLACLLFFSGSARALPLAAPINYCQAGGDPERCYTLGKALQAVFAEWALDFGVGVAKAVDGLVWMLGRASAFIFSVVVDSQWLASLKDQLLQAMSSLMPDILRQVVLGDSGLMYVAMALAGVLMTLPLIGGGEARLVRPERVMLWGVLLVVLFIGGSSSITGYDLVGAVEDLRVKTMGTIMGQADNPVKLITSPMMTSSWKFGAGSELMKLPDAFLSTYFIEKQTEEVTVLLEEGGWNLGNIKVESQDSAEQRSGLAGSSLLFAGVCLLGAYTLLLFSLTFALLSVAALVLILFLFAALPLGFFEFGNLILKSILEKYLQAVVFSFGMALFIRWISGWIESIPAASGVQSALTSVSLTLVVIVALHIILNGALGLLVSSTQVFSTSVQSVFTGGPNVLGGLGGAATGALAGALSGGAGGALMGALAGGTQGTAEGASMFSTFTQGALSAVGLSAAAGGLAARATRPAPARGDVFQQPAEAELPPVTTPTHAATPQVETHPAAETQPKTGVFTPGLAEAETTLQALAAREGWQREQMELLRNISQHSANPSEAVSRLQNAPGFERSDPETLLRAVQSAQSLPAENAPGSST